MVFVINMSDNTIDDFIKIFEDVADGKTRAPKWFGGAILELIQDTKKNGAQIQVNGEHCRIVPSKNP